MPDIGDRLDEEVRRLVDRYELGERIRPCWARHPSAVAELEVVLRWREELTDNPATTATGGRRATAGGRRWMGAGRRCSM